MSLTIRIPTQLRTLTGRRGEVEVEAASVGEALKALDAANPGLADRLFDEAGELRRFVNVFLADEDVRFLDGLATPVVDGQTLSIVPAVAGADRSVAPATDRCAAAQAEAGSAPLGDLRRALGG